MNKLCHEYISEVKALFPIMGQSEKKYIQNLETNIEDFCDDADVTSKETLYKAIGLPSEVVNEYYSTIDTDYVIKRIRLTRNVKMFLISLLILFALTMSVCCSVMYSTHESFKSEEMINTEASVN